MRRAFRKRNALAVHDLHYGPNMTPMVDVVMVILIFFMASAAIIGPEWFIRSALPVAKRGPSTGAKDDGATIRIQAKLRRASARTEVIATVDGKDARVLGLAEFVAFLQSKLDERPAERIIVLITPDAAVPYDDVVRAHEAAHRLGITQAGLFDLRELSGPAIELPAGGAAGGSVESPADRPK